MQLKYVAKFQAVLNTVKQINWIEFKKKIHFCNP